MLLGAHRDLRVRGYYILYIVPQSVPSPKAVDQRLLFFGNPQTNLASSHLLHETWAERQAVPDRRAVLALVLDRPRGGLCGGACRIVLVPAGPNPRRKVQRRVAMGEASVPTSEGAPREASASQGVQPQSPVLAGRSPKSEALHQRHLAPPMRLALASRRRRCQTRLLRLSHLHYPASNPRRRRLQHPARVQVPPAVRSTKLRLCG